MADQSIDSKFATDPVVTPAATDRIMVSQGGTTRVETRAQIHALESGEHLVLPEVNEVGTPTISFGGDTGFYSSGGDQLKVSTAGTNRFIWVGTQFRGDNNASGGHLNEAASATNPTFVPDISDIDTGLGHAAADQLSLIAGAIEGIQIKETGTVTTDQIILFPDGLHVGNAAATPTLAFGDGDSGIYETIDDTLYVTLAGAGRWEMGTVYFGAINGNRPVLINDNASATVPTLIPMRNDSDTGIGRTAADQLSLIAGAKEMLRLVETGTATTDQVIIGPAGVIGAAATPSLAFGDGDSGFFEGADDTIQVTLGGTAKWQFTLGDLFGTVSSNGPGLRNSTATATTPTLIPANADLDTGIGLATTDALSLVSGAIEALRLTEVSSHVIQQHEAQVGITANANSSQGDTPLLSTYNVISVVATAGDAVTLPAAFGVGTQIYVKNDDSAESMDIFPASGDDAGAGANTAVALAAGVGTLFVATAANATWTQMF